MKLIQSEHETTRARQTDEPSDELRIAITFRRPQDRVSVKKAKTAFQVALPSMQVPSKPGKGASDHAPVVVELAD